MNALNVGSAAEVRPALRPLVFATPRGRYVWVEHGYGFILDTRGFGTWGAVVGELRGGTVLKPHQVTALVAAYGRPVPS